MPAKLSNAFLSTDLSKPLMLNPSPNPGSPSGVGIRAHIEGFRSAQDPPNPFNWGYRAPRVVGGSVSA